MSFVNPAAETTSSRPGLMPRILIAAAPQGTANYYNVKIGGDVIPDAAWYYPDTKPKAKEFENYVAFYKVSFRLISLISRLLIDYVPTRTRCRSTSDGFRGRTAFPSVSRFPGTAST